MKRAALITVLLAPCALAQGPGFDTPHVVLDHELRPTRVKLLSLSRDTLSARKQDGAMLSIPVADVEALLLNKPAPTRAVLVPGSQPSQHVLRFTDGRTFRGSLQIPVDPPKEQIIFASASLGPVQVPLDSLTSIAFNPVVRPVAAMTDDVLMLANGDRLEGFVESVAEQVVLSSKDAAKEPASIPLESLDAITFASPELRPAGSFVWTTDETLAFESVSIATSGETTLRLIAPDRSPKELTTTIDSIVAIAFDMDRLVPLARLPIERSESLGERRWSPPATSSAASDSSVAPDLDVIGPAAVTWTLPENARRVAGVATLPAGCRDWGDFTMTLSFGADPQGKPAFSARLTGGAPEAEFNLEIPKGAGSITLAIDSGPSGPIQDRVRLSRTLVLAHPSK